MEFEQKIADYLGVEYALGVASGTAALILSLRSLALKIKKKEFFDKKDEIITTGFTFIATAAAIKCSGATPVFVDIDSDTFNLSPEAVKKAVTKHTVGIIPVHLYGLAADMDAIMNISRKNNLFVLEDTAQAFGASYRNKKLGTIGNLGTFSFFPSKNLGGYGDGGLIVTNNQQLASLINVLRNHGQIKPYKAEYLGYNSRLDSLQAAVLLAKLKYIDKFNKLRRKAAKLYNAGLKDIKQITTPVECDMQYSNSGGPENYSHIYHLYTIKVSSRRNALLRYLNSKSIGARLYYPIPLYAMKIFKDCKMSSSFKNIQGVLSKILTLPINPFLKYEEIKYITNHIRTFFEK